MAPFDGKYLISYLIAIVMFALLLTIYKIFTKRVKCQKFDLKNDLKNEGQRGDNGTFTIRPEMFDSIYR